ncbi:hypothetical protein SCAB_55652 [Streptomyces scabiei 87.22]|uniref:Uncharacterized protein n=1 Tax=Streptomyces scabiei (strain 87.22) TaxID=680198 RepID=C9Z0Y5_STRSW|nr:hypothetical protein SCAB_55652 [Streptomyces scabiei 87.22]
MPDQCPPVDHLRSVTSLSATAYVRIDHRVRPYPERRPPVRGNQRPGMSVFPSNTHGYPYVLADTDTGSRLTAGRTKANKTGGTSREDDSPVPRTTALQWVGTPAGLQGVTRQASNRERMTCGR